MKENQVWISVKVKSCLVTTVEVSERTLEFLRRAFPDYVWDEQKGLNYKSFCMDFRDKFTEDEIDRIFKAVRDFYPDI